MTTDAYDPFAGLDDNREVHQRINQTLSQCGSPAVLDWGDIDTLAEEISANDLSQTLKHDLRKLAASTVEDYLTYRERLIDQPENGLRVLFEFDHSVAFPIANLEEVPFLAEKYLPAQYHVCEVQSARQCLKVGATHVLRVIYGDFVCLYKCCDECLLWFGNARRRYDENTGFGFSIASMGSSTIWHPATQ